MRVFATYNIKGGVGKTTSAVNLAYLSAQDGARTLLWDLDPQGAATFYFRIEARIKGGGKKLIRGKRPLELTIRGTDYPGLDLLPADFSYRHMDIELERTGNPAGRLASLLMPLSFQYDTLFLDCAPSISLVSESVFAASDFLLVPTIPTTLSIRTLHQLESHLGGRERRGPRILPFFCMVDRRKTLHKTISGELAEAPPATMLRTVIPSSSVVERMGIHRSPLAVFAPRSAAATAYEELWREISSSAFGRGSVIQVPSSRLTE